MRLLATIVVALTFFLTNSANAQTYPDKPVKLVVPFAAGSGTDTIGRALAKAMEGPLGQSVLVENRTGAGSQIGVGYVANSAADGYTLVFVDPSVVTTPSLKPGDTPYQLKQLKVIATITKSSLIVTVHPSLPVNNLKELVEYSQKQPDGVSYASSGIGTTPHLGPELFRVQSGFKAKHVPYRGAALAVPDLISGRVQVAFFTNATALPLAKEGKLRAIAQTGAKRTAFTPDVPTAVESGFPNLVVDIWFAVFTSAGIPADAERKLTDAVRKAVASPEFLAVLNQTGYEIFHSDGAAAESFVQTEYERWNAVIKAANIVAE